MLKTCPTSIKLRVSLIVFCQISIVLMMASCARGPASARMIVSSTLPVQVLWNVQLDRRTTQQPLLTEEMAIVTTERDLIALSITTGEEIWRYRLKGYLLTLPIVNIDNLVVIGEKGGVISALALDTGHLVWQQDLSTDAMSYIHGISVTGNLLIVVGQPILVSALKFEDGTVQWKLDMWAHSYLSQALYVTTYHKQVYLLDEKTYIVNPATGTIDDILEVDLRHLRQIGSQFFADKSFYDLGNPLRSWQPLPRVPRASDCSGFVQPYIVGKQVIIGGADCEDIYALDKEEGEVRWRYLSESYASLPLAILDNSVYVLFESGEIHAIVLDNGENLGVLRTDSELGEYTVGGLSTSRGISSNGDVLVVTFNEATVIGLGFLSN